jgi:hypothetical protein
MNRSRFALGFAVSMSPTLLFVADVILRRYFTWWKPGAGVLVAVLMVAAVATAVIIASSSVSILRGVGLLVLAWGWIIAQVVIHTVALIRYSGFDGTQ